MRKMFILVGLILVSVVRADDPPIPPIPDSSRSADLNVGESQQLVFADGKKVTLRLVDLKETTASLRRSVRPAHVDGGDGRHVRKICYHYGLDMGGAEEQVEVVAATDGIVISSGKAILAGYEKSPAKPRYDVVYLLDGRGWFYRYSHLYSIHP